jgi:lipopolysaccharide export system permease protein
VIASLLLTLTVFTFVLLLGNVLKEILTLLINGQASPMLVLEAIALLVPFVWVFALPMGLLTATLLVFGRFSADQELTAARASGISLISLVTPVLLLSLVCCGLSAWVNTDLGPRARVAYKNLIFRARAQFVNVQLPEGRFVSDIPGYIFYVEKNDSGNLKNVTIIKPGNGTNSTITIQAPTGHIEMDATNKQLVLDLFQARSIIYGERTSIQSAPELILDLNPNLQTNQVYYPKISDMTFWQLRDTLNMVEQRFDSMSSMTSTNAAAPKKARAEHHSSDRPVSNFVEPIRVEMHRQIACSFACFGFTLVGIPLGIRMHRRETNIGFAIGLALAVIYYSFMLMGEMFSSRADLAPHLIFWLPNFVFQAVGAALLWRANRGV